MLLQAGWSPSGSVTRDDVELSRDESLGIFLIAVSYAFSRLRLRHDLCLERGFHADVDDFLDAPFKPFMSLSQLISNQRLCIYSYFKATKDFFVGKNIAMPDKEDKWFERGVKEALKDSK